MKRTAVALLAVLALAGPVAGAGNLPSRLDIDYRPPQLSVEASGLTLAEILRAIGAKVGFSVVDSGAQAEPVTISIRDASVEDALRQLLRGTNHSLVYGQDNGSGSTPIDKIVLLGAPGSAPAAGPPERPQATAALPVTGNASRAAIPVPAPQPPVPDGVPSAVLAPYTPPLNYSAPTNPLLSWDPGPNGDLGADPATGSANPVGDLLRMHAQSAAQAVSTPANAPQTSLPVPSVDASLAETTRRAQQDLAALVKGLAAATRALQESLAADPK